MSAAAGGAGATRPAPSASKHPQTSHGSQHSTHKVPDEWHIELPGRGTDRTASDRYFGGCRSIEKGYSRGDVLGHGTYGEVFLAYDKDNGDVVAAKKIKMDNEREGFPITAIREIKILSALANATEAIDDQLLRNNVITLREIVRSDSHASNDRKGSIYMIFDYMDHDLAGLLERQSLANTRFPIPVTKCYVRQLLFGLALLEHKNVLHRDLKNANLLVNNRGELKIADFGLARYYQPKSSARSGGEQQVGSNRDMTNRVITLWYRPPELFLGCKHYGSEIDIWSAGCIMAELLMGKALFAGRDEGDQADKIFNTMGQPTEASMPGCTEWQYYNSFNISKYPKTSKLRQHLQQRGVDDFLALELLENMLALDPAKRITAREAAMHQWFYADPLPLPKDRMPKCESSHEMAMKRRRHDVMRGGGAHSTYQAQQQPQQVQQQQQGPPAQRQRTHGQYTGPTHGGGHHPQQQQQQQQQQHSGYPQHGGRGGSAPRYPQGGTGPGRGGAPPAAAAAASTMQPGYRAPPIPGVITSEQVGMRYAPPQGPPHGGMPPPAYGRAPGVQQQQQQQQHGYGGYAPQQQHGGGYRGGGGYPQHGGGGSGYGGPRPPPQQGPGWANQRR